MRLHYLTVVAVLTFPALLQGSHCPCVPSSDLGSSLPNSSFPTQLLLCIETTFAAQSLLASSSPKKLNLNYRLISETSKYGERDSNAETPEGCSVVVSIVDKNPSTLVQRERCPGVCKKIPYITLPQQSLKLLPEQNSVTFSKCSMNLTISYHRSNSTTYLSEALKAIATRKLLECDENFHNFYHSWDYHTSATFASTDDYTITINGLNKIQSQSSPITRRTVYGVVMWIASLSRIKMAENQIRVLTYRQKLHDDQKRIVGWVAADDVYPCMAGSTICSDKITTKQSQSQYNADMPFTLLDKATTPPGWACAQRRPLRALAHVLRLYDPDFVLLVDDDTFVNVKFLSYGSILSSYILTSMRHENIVLGEMNVHDKKTTATGFYFGGAGYLMGRGVLSNLSGTTISSRGYSKSDIYRTKRQIKNLGLLEDALMNSNASCAACIQPRQSSGKIDSRSSILVSQTADMSIRVIDLCVNMMADMGTCYHSDHSLTRCFAHGTYSDTKSAGCESPLNVTFGGEVIAVSMCYEGISCDLKAALTCHRYVSNIQNSTLIPKNTLQRTPFL